MIEFVCLTPENVIYTKSHKYMDLQLLSLLLLHKIRMTFKRGRQCNHSSTMDEEEGIDSRETVVTYITLTQHYDDDKWLDFIDYGSWIDLNHRR